MTNLVRNMKLNFLQLLLFSFFIIHVVLEIAFDRRLKIRELINLFIIGKICTQKNVRFL